MWFCEFGPREKVLLFYFCVLLWADVFMITNPLLKVLESKGCASKRHCLATRRYGFTVFVSITKVDKGAGGCWGVLNFLLSWKHQRCFLCRFWFLGDVDGAQPGNQPVDGASRRYPGAHTAWSPITGKQWYSGKWVCLGWVGVVIAI